MWKLIAGVGLVAFVISQAIYVRLNRGDFDKYREQHNEHSWRIDQEVRGLKQQLESLEQEVKQLRSDMVNKRPAAAQAVQARSEPANATPAPAHNDLDDLLKREEPEHAPWRPRVAPSRVKPLPEEVLRHPDRYLSPHM